MLPNFKAPWFGYGPRLAMEIAELLTMDRLKHEALMGSIKEEKSHAPRGR
jgi:hypothetical protein